MLQELRKKIEELHMVTSDDKIFAGVSGGADSVCLLVALKELQKSLRFSLEVIHVEHGIRGEESKSDARYVENLCKRLGVDVQIYEVDAPSFALERGLGLEEAARILRYQIFEKVALEKGAKIALAHHKEDNAETILFQMVRGSSLAGLCGMKPVRKDENGVCYIRPLLFFHRREIEAFLEEYKIEWCEDCTNGDLEYSRNFLRGKVIPQLEKLNPQAVAHMNQTAEHLTEVQDYIAKETQRVWSLLVNVDEMIKIDAKGLLEQHPMMQRQIAYKAIVDMAGGKKDITSVHVAELIELCKGQSGKRVSLPYGLVAYKEFAVVCVSKEAETESKTAEYEVSQETLEQLLQSQTEKIIRLGSDGAQIRCRVFEKIDEYLEIPRKTYTKWLDYDKIKGRLCIRTRRSGDYLVSDANGHRKKLKSYFIDEKIPLTERGKRWLLTQEDEVFWVIGGRMSEHVKVSQETKYIFQITYDGGKENE